MPVAAAGAADPERRLLPSLGGCKHTAGVGGEHRREQAPGYAEEDEQSLGDRGVLGRNLERVGDVVQQVVLVSRDGGDIRAGTVRQGHGDGVTDRGVHRLSGFNAEDAAVVTEFTVDDLHRGVSGGVLSVEAEDLGRAAGDGAANVSGPRSARDSWVARATPGNAAINWASSSSGTVAG